MSYQGVVLVSRGSSNQRVQSFSVFRRLLYDGFIVLRVYLSHVSRFTRVVYQSAYHRASYGSFHAVSRGIQRARQGRGQFLLYLVGI